MPAQFSKSMRFIFLAAAGAGVSLGLIGCEEDKPASKPVIRAVKTIVVKPVSASERRQISGKVQAVNTTSLGFEVSGTVAQMKVDVGDRVKKGQILAQLDQREYQLDVEGAEAALRKAKANLVKEATNYEAQKTLYEKKVAAKAAYDKALASYRSAQESVKETQSKLAISKRDLANTTLKAPIDGVITKRYVDPAVVVSTGRVIYDLQGAGDLEAAVNVPDQMVKVLKKGDPAVVTFPTVPDLKLAGKVKDIGAAGEEANTFPVTVLLISPTADVRVGMAAEVTFTLRIPGVKSAFALPVSAFVPGDGKNKRTGFVYVFDAASKTVKRREVFVIAIRGNDVLVGKGLKAGERVAVAGVSFLHDGMTVKLLAQK